MWEEPQGVVFRTNCNRNFVPLAGIYLVASTGKCVVRITRYSIRDKCNRNFLPFGGMYFDGIYWKICGKNHKV